MKRFNVVIPNVAGGIEVHPMKEWLRKHPDQVPAGMDASQNNSHSLRDGLRKLGWLVQEGPTEVRLAMPGLPPILEENMDSILGAVEDPETTETEDEAEAAFELEYQLRDFIAHNLTSISIAGRRLRLYCDSNGRGGVEYPTAVGPIDILEIDEVGNFVVFELKRARGSDYTIGQLARYMGWIKRSFGQSVDVHGVIVARSISNNLRYAASIVQNVSLYEYKINFELKTANELPE